MTGRVVVVGSLNTDLVVRTARLPRPGETVPGASLATLPGGKGLNQATAARRSGAETLMVGAVGDDASGRALLAFLAEEDIGTAHVARVPGPSGTAVVLVDDSGENAIAVVAGANAQAGTPVPDLAATDVVLLQAEIPEDACLAAGSAARAVGATVVLNLAPYRPLGGALADLVDVLVVNETEFAQLLQVDAVPDVPRALADNADAFPAVVVTVGAEGAYLRTAGVVAHQPGIALAAVDTTGAGDCFCGALAAGLAGGLSTAAAVTGATAAAALSVTRPGAAPAMPTRAEVEALLRP